MTEVPAHLRHYPDSWARRRYDCDCRKCLPSGEPAAGRPPLGERRMSNTERDRKLRHGKRGKPVPPHVKHGRYTIRVYRCNCEEVCKPLKRELRDRQRNPWKYKPTLRGRWSVGYRGDQQVSILCWPPKDAGPDWQCPDPSHHKERAS